MNEWNKERINYLVEHYGDMTTEQIAKHLNMPVSKIIYRARALGLTIKHENKCDVWTKEEDDYLIKNYRNHDIKMLSKHLNRSEPSIYVRASKLGVKRQKSHGAGMKFWTTKEEKILRENYKTKTWEEMHELIPAHSVSGIRNYAKRIGLRKQRPPQLSQENLKFIEENCKHMSGTRIAKMIGCAESTVNRHINKITGRETPNKTWSQEEIAFLEAYFDKISSIEIANELGNRSPASVRMKARALGLKSNHQICKERGYYLCIDCGKKVDLDPNKKRSKYGKRCHECFLNHVRLTSPTSSYNRFKREREEAQMEYERKRKETENEYYKCYKCKQTKLGKEFAFNRSNLKRRNMCKECQRIENKERVNNMYKKKL